jgi:hypothetical protein
LTRNFPSLLTLHLLPVHATILSASSVLSPAPLLIALLLHWSMRSFAIALTTALHSSMAFLLFRIRPLEGVLRAAARLIFGLSKYDHVSALMRDNLHWLPFRSRITFRVTSFAWRSVLGAAPTYLTRYFMPTAALPGRSCLRAAARGDVMVPFARTACMQKRAFSIVGPNLWNALAPEIKSLSYDQYASFYRLLKTYLFDLAWMGSASE